MANSIYFDQAVSDLRNQANQFVYSDCEEQMQLKCKMKRIARWEALVQDLVVEKKLSIMQYMGFMSLLYKKSFEYQTELDLFLPY